MFGVMIQNQAGAIDVINEVIKVTLNGGILARARQSRHFAKCSLSDL